MSSNAPLYQNLDTTFVNLWSLLRKLTEQGFIGRVHVDLKDYSADVFLDGSSTPLVREIDRAANTDNIETGALHRVVLRARETPGVINVYEGAAEAKVPQSQASISEPRFSVETPNISQPDKIDEVPIETPAMTNFSSSGGEQAPVSTGIDTDVYPSGSYQDWPAILLATGELISAVERGVDAAGADFASLFNAVRLALADDYFFLDPIAQTLHYSNGVAFLKSEPPVSVFVSGLSEALRRVVDRVAVGERARRVRERIALEIVPIARNRAEVMERSGFGAQLDRIAGTRVM